MNGINADKTVSVHYVGTFDDGTEFDSSRSRGKTLSFKVGSGQMIPGFDSAVENMSPGEKKSIRLEPSDAYGETREDLFQSTPLSAFPVGFEPVVDATVQGEAPNGQPVLARIASAEEDSVVLDFNHPMAGKHLNFEIELLSIE